MSEQASKEVSLRYLKQICFVVAILLILYGIAQLLDFLLDFFHFYVDYYLWMVFRIIAAFLIMAIGFLVYLMTKTLRTSNLSQLLKEAKSELSVKLLASAVLLAVTLSPFTAPTPASYLTNSIILDGTYHTAFIPRSWTENPAFEGKATGFIYSWVTLENNRVLVHDGYMGFLWGNYSYRLFDLNTGDVYFTTEDAQSRGFLLTPLQPFYLVYFEGGRPTPYSFWSRDDLSISRIHIVEGSQQYPFVTGELLNNVIPAWNMVEAQYSHETDSKVKGLEKTRYNAVTVFIRPFWSESDRTLKIVMQKTAYFDDGMDIYVAPIYLLTVCFVFNNSGEYLKTYIVPPL